MLKTIFVENFMRINHRVDVPLSPVTVLVGGNGSGKSSILKAVHWAVRCATLRDRKDNTTLEQMDYTPSRAFQELAHKKRVQNKGNMPKVRVGFIGNDDAETIISISAARNDAGAKAPIIGPLSRTLTDQDSPSTAYIPGLAGLAEVETVLAAPILHRRAASGEGGSVLRHILLDLAGDNAGGAETTELTELSQWVSRVIPGSRFWVKFDRIRDVSISAHFFTPEMHETGRSVNVQRRPLEMAGTGYLQIVQIFAYLLKFKPKLLLIDEPDAHLHASTQERLITALEQAASEFPDTQFLITTHSPSFVRACGESTLVHWMDQGQRRVEGQETIKARMGWGALDKEAILFTEDEKVSHIKNIMRQWPSLDRRVLVWPTFGNSGLMSGQSISRLRSTLGIPILVHRDRDFMSDNDITEWGRVKGYEEHSVPYWITSGSDIESEFCTPTNIARCMELNDAEAIEVYESAINSFQPADVERDFNTAIHAATASIPAALRSIPSARWRDLGEFGGGTIKGKMLFPAIEEAIRRKLAGTPEAPRLAHLHRLGDCDPSNPICLDLKVLIEAALQPPA